MIRLNIWIMLITASILMTACNGDETSPEEAAEETRIIEIIGTDDMRFVVEQEDERLVTGEQDGEVYELEQILANPGEEIRIIMTSRSELPATAMAHNFILLEPDMETDDFVLESITAPDNEYIAPDLEEFVIAATDLLAGGETDAIEFTVPEEVGEFDFVCSFPGHFAAGMAGQLVVE